MLMKIPASYPKPRHLSPMLDRPWALAEPFSATARGVGLATAKARGLVVRVVKAELVEEGEAASSMCPTSELRLI